MINGHSVVALVTARGGSKGVRRKNLREIAGRSLLARAIEAAQGAETVDRVVLSSEDPEIIAAAIASGCDAPFVRPACLASDEATTMDVVRHALKALPESYDYLVVLQPTSPLRIAADIDGAVDLCFSAGAPACVSVSEPDHPPHWAFTRDDKGRLSPLIADGPLYSRRQDLPPTLMLNGAVYVALCDWIIEQSEFTGEETVGYVMPKERAVDVDDELDLVVAEALARKLDHVEFVRRRVKMA
ncbi:MAG: acylneuraminate cytidylyltransferase family protein [Alphaproteobacteria bacterium]